MRYRAPSVEGGIQDADLQFRDQPLLMHCNELVVEAFDAVADFSGDDEIDDGSHAHRRQSHRPHA